MAKDKKIDFEIRLGEDDLNGFHLKGEVDEKEAMKFIHEHGHELSRLIGVRASLRARAHLRRVRGGDCGCH